MNAIRKPTFHAARYNRVKYLGSDVRSRPLQSAPMDFFCPRNGCNIAPGNDPPSEAVAEVWHRFFENFSAADFSPHLRRASCTFVCRQTTVWHTKGARSARPGVRPRVERHLNRYLMDNRPKTDGSDDPTTTDPETSAGINIQTPPQRRAEHPLQARLLCKAGLEHNRSRFIVKRIFAEEFVVIKRDPSKTQFIARLNEFYFQFQKLANNCAPVKAI